jgi:hypothetical protein
LSRGARFLSGVVGGVSTLAGLIVLVALLNAPLVLGASSGIVLLVTLPIMGGLIAALLGPRE